MWKLTVVGLFAFAFAVLALLFARPKLLAFKEPNKATPASEELLSVPEGRQAVFEVDRDLLQQIKSQLSSIEARLRVLEQRPATFPPGLPSVPATLPAVPPLQLPDGIDAPWAWIGKLDPGKRVSVEKAFEEAAASARSRMPPLGSVPDESSLGAAKEGLDQDLANRLRAILSPPEFEAYLSSLPSALRDQIEAGKPENR